MSGSTANKAHAAAAAVAVLFSLNYVISKLGMHAFSPMVFAFLRVTFAAVILNLVLAFAPPQRGEGAPERSEGADEGPLTPALSPLRRGEGEGGGWSRADWLRVTGYAVLGVVINQALFLSGLALTSAHVAAILMTAIPLFALGAAIVMGRERATGAKVGGIALAFGGAVLIVTREGLEGAGKSLTGDLMLLGNALAYALYLVLSKRDMKRLGPRRVIARMFAIGSVLMLPLAAVPMAREHWATIPLRAWLALGLVIAGPTVLAYLLNAWALAHAESSLVAAYTYLQPVITALLAAAFLGETIGPAAIAAGVVIFAGVWLAGRAATPL